MRPGAGGAGEGVGLLKGARQEEEEEKDDEEDMGSEVGVSNQQFLHGTFSVFFSCSIPPSPALSKSPISTRKAPLGCKGDTWGWCYQFQRRNSDRIPVRG